MARALRESGLYVTGTSDAELAALPGELADACRHWRVYHKQATAFGRTWLERVQEGRVYPEWRQLGAEATGRMSCRDPNLQQLPRAGQYRHCVTAAPGCVLIAADYSQIELRIAALVARDPAMLRAYQQGDDLHTLSARSLFGREKVSKDDRQIAKSANFGLLYGMGAAGLQAYSAATYGVELTLEQATELRQKWLGVYSGIQRWHREAHGRLQNSPSGVEVRTLAGRRRTDVRSYTQVLNTPVQGLGADGLKAALGLLWATREAHGGERWRPALLCHDEIVIEAPAEEAEAAGAWLRECMVAGMQPLLRHQGLEVPCEVEVSTGDSWGACK
ncbi:MAG: hypothetical protein FJX77_03065 [Armatimonadetes bacterium]|nr:hypothetical protein [Armatimonadota bacterium]